MAQDCRVLQKGRCEISDSYYTGHEAVDLVGENYTLDYIVAHSDGTVVEVEKNVNENTSGDPKYGSTRVSNIYGNYVKIQHSGGMYTLYAHLKYGTVNVNVGDKVTKGQVIGYMGLTGYAFGAHLHFEVRNSLNVKINAIPYINADLQGGETLKIGNYICNYDMKVRSGPGLNYSVKKVSELTADGKRNATSTNMYAYAVYKEGTIFTAYEIINTNDGVWARSPSGYICIRDNQTLYCSKI